MSFELGDTMRTIFLAGVGAIATSAEKSQEIVDELVKKGELTVKQGQSLNEELTHKAKDAYQQGTDSLLRAKLEAMTPEQRAAYASKVAQFAQEIDEQDAAEKCRECEDDDEDECGCDDDCGCEDECCE